MKVLQIALGAVFALTRFCLVRIAIRDRGSRFEPPPPPTQEETQGRFRKRAVLANVPSFRVLVQGNIRMYPRPGFGAGKHPNVPSFRVCGTGNIRQNYPFGKALLRTPRQRLLIFLLSRAKKNPKAKESHEQHQRIF